MHRTKTYLIFRASVPNKQMHLTTKSGDLLCFWWSGDL